MKIKKLISLALLIFLCYFSANAQFEKCTIYYNTGVEEVLYVKFALPGIDDKLTIKKTKDSKPEKINLEKISFIGIELSGKKTLFVITRRTEISKRSNEIQYKDRDNKYRISFVNGIYNDIVSSEGGYKFVVKENKEGKYILIKYNDSAPYGRFLNKINDDKLFSIGEMQTSEIKHKLVIDYLFGSCASNFYDDNIRKKFKKQFKKHLEEYQLCSEN